MKPTHMEDLIKGHGYAAETHEVVTHDGYILRLHRIPAGKNQESSKPRPVALLFHGLLSSSDCFLFRGPKFDLPYLLADAGYDMWLMNTRGNYNSKGHVTLNSDTDSKYWNFSFHEAGIGDLPAAIDYILKRTGQKDLYYIGYSLGSAVGFVLCAEKPQYNSKIRLIVNLAPSGYAVGKRRPIIELILNILPIVTNILSVANINQILPSRTAIAHLLTALCEDGSPTQHICMWVLFSFVGVDKSKFNSSIMPDIFKNFPAGTSLLTVVHLHQLMTSGHFRPLTRVTEKSRSEYDGNEPPDYDVGKITAPAVLYCGSEDFLVTKSDCEALGGKLSNLVGLFEVPFNHMDFMWGTNAKRVLYEQLVSLMNKYR